MCKRPLNSTKRRDVALLQANIAALASIPLRARSRRDVPLGWLVVTYDQAQDFTPEREQFLSTLNDSAAVALDNRYLLQSTENALQETAALYGATTNLSRARSQDEIATAVQGAFESLGPNIYAAYLSRKKASANCSTSAWTPRRSISALWSPSMT